METFAGEVMAWLGRGRKVTQEVLDNWARRIIALTSQRDEARRWARKLKRERDEYCEDSVMLESRLEHAVADRAELLAMWKQAYAWVSICPKCRADLRTEEHATDCPWRKWAKE